jgi:hypothetical protein
MVPSQQLNMILAARLGKLDVGSIVASAFAPRLRLLHKLFYSFFFFSPTAMPLPWFAEVDISVLHPRTSRRPQ